MAFFSIENLAIAFGGLRALQGISFEVQEKEVFSIIGPNGAGKTTLFNCINGIYRPDDGVIRFGRENIQHLRPDQIARLGIARTFQNIELFANMTTMENIMLGRHIFMRTGLFHGAGMWGRRSFAGREERSHRRRVEEIIDLLRLQSVRGKLVGGLPYGIQKLVELARALALEPKLLLLDEPCAGMTSEEKQDMIFWIKDIQDDLGITILLIEHDMRMVMDISDRILAINFGQPIVTGTADEVRRHPEVLKAYLEKRKTVNPLLEIRNIETYYDLICAIRGASLTVMEGSVTAILGNNGAGKSTILKTLMGLIEDQPDKGSILFEGRRIDGRDTEDIVRRGISYVPEGREVFEELSVRENLLMGAYVRRDRDGIRQDFERVYDYFPILANRTHQWAGTLSGGEQQMLAIGRALMSRPKLLCLDEPSLGLSPLLVKEIFRIITQINAEGVTILLVEQNARMALNIADMGLILENGRFVMKGASQELLNDPNVKEFYLGMQDESSAKGYQRWKRKRRWR